MQRHRVVALHVAGAIEQHDVTTPGSVKDGTPGVGLAVQLGEIPAPQLQPATGIMAGPAAERIAGRHFLQPAVQKQSFLLQPARPRTVHVACPCTQYNR